MHVQLSIQILPYGLEVGLLRDNRVGIVSKNLEIWKVVWYRQGLVFCAKASLLVRSELVNQRLSPRLNALFVGRFQPTDGLAEARLGSFTRHLDTAARDPIREIVSAAHKSYQNHAFAVEPQGGDIQVVYIVKGNVRRRLGTFAFGGPIAKRLCATKHDGVDVLAQYRIHYAVPLQQRALCFRLSWRIVDGVAK